MSVSPSPSPSPLLLSLDRNGFLGVSPEPNPKSRIGRANPHEPAGKRSRLIGVVTERVLAAELQGKNLRETDKSLDSGRTLKLRQVDDDGAPACIGREHS